MAQHSASAEHSRSRAVPQFKSTVRAAHLIVVDNKSRDCSTTMDTCIACAVSRLGSVGGPHRMIAMFAVMQDHILDCLGGYADSL